MNERIDKLAEQAGMGHERWNTTVQFESFLEKLAELIVRECAELNFRELGLSGSDSFDVSRMIKQHFGVEE